MSSRFTALHVGSNIETLLVIHVSLLSLCYILLTVNFVCGGEINIFVITIFNIFAVVNYSGTAIPPPPQTATTVSVANLFSFSYSFFPLCCGQNLPVSAQWRPERKRTKGVGPGHTLAWPGWKKPEIPMDEGRENPPWRFQWKWTRADLKLAVRRREF